MLDWISSQILTSVKTEAIFKDKILCIICDLILKIRDEEEIFEKCQSRHFESTTHAIQEWLMKGKVKLDKTSVMKIKAMSIIAKTDYLQRHQMDFFSQKLFELAPKWKGEIQTEALVVLNALSVKIDHEIHEEAFRLISAMHGLDGRNLAAQLLWKSLKNPNKVRLNDNLLLNEEYKGLFTEGKINI